MCRFCDGLPINRNLCDGERGSPRGSVRDGLQGLLQEAVPICLPEGVSSVTELSSFPGLGVIMLEDSIHNHS